MNKRRADTPVRIFVVESERRVADAVFNPNGYPAELHDTVLACGRRLALFLHDHSLCLEAVARDRALLVTRMLDPRVGVEALSRDLLRGGVVAVMDAVTYTRSLHGLLYALKSLLDVYAGLVVRAIVPGTGIMTFKRARIDGTEALAGGRLINWLRRSAPRGCPGAEALASAFESHSRSWITVAVGLRDQLTHYDDASALVDLHARLRDEPPFLTEADVIEPRLKSGERLDHFVARVHSGTLGLLSASIPLIPGIDVLRIRLDDLTYDPTHVVLRIETTD